MPRGSQKMKANIQRLIDERDRLLSQLNATKHKIEGLDLAIQLMGHERSAPSEEKGTDTSKRGQAKGVLLDLLKEVGTIGLNATSAVELADRRGIKLERGTAASNLSRMKADGVVIYDNDRYRLPEFSRPPMTVVQGGAKGS
jgi:hypothetical protein